VSAKVRELVQAGDLAVPASNEVFGDPIPMHVKRLKVEYTLNGKAISQTVAEGEVLTLAEADASMTWPAGRVVLSSQGRPELLAMRPGTYVFRTAAGKNLKAEVKTVPEPLEVSGPWTLHFLTTGGSAAGHPG